MAESPTKSRFWYRVRMALYTVAAVQGFAAPIVNPPAEVLVDLSGPVRVVAIILSMLAPLGMGPVVFIVIAITAINPFADDHWPWPNHDTNPLQLGNPLPFFHFFSYFILAAAGGALLATPFAGWLGVGAAVALALGGLSCLAGVHAAARFATNKTRPPHVSTEDNG